MVEKWLDEVIEAVTAQLPTASQRGDGGRRRLGKAHFVELGRYRISMRNKQIRLDNYTDLRLATDSFNDAESYRLVAAVEGVEELEVQVGKHAPETGMWLWGVGRPAGFLYRSQLEALKRLQEPGLAEQVAHGRFDSLPATGSGHSGLDEAQAVAYSACTTPGVRLVWGPPGTGKTTVLSRAIDNLLSRGKRVLLVSGTNVAVDNALEGALRLRPDAEQGELLRVGTPHLRRIASDPNPRIVR